MSNHSVARAGGTLIAQTYISSNPASALVLISPPTSNSSKETEHLLPGSLNEFDYEARFPLLLLDTPTQMEKQITNNRLVKDEGVDHVAVAELDGAEAQIAIERWMDTVGV